MDVCEQEAKKRKEPQPHPPAIWLVANDDWSEYEI